MNHGKERMPAQAVIEAFLAEGVEYVFGLVGSHVLAIYDALAQAPTIRQIVAKHENNAAFMAEMYGRLTGRPGVVLVTAGPGALNSISAVAQAYQNSSPMVHISGTVATTSGVGEFHGTDRPDFLQKMFAEVTKWSVRVERPEETPAILARAFHLATQGRPGPVHVEIPFDVLRSASAAMPLYARLSAAPTVVDAAGVHELAQRLAQAKHPVLCVGPGVLIHRASDLLAALAERLAAPVIVAGDALGALPETHPWFAGSMTAYQLAPWLEGQVRRADAFLVLGMREGSREVKALQAIAPPHATWVRLYDATTDRTGGASFSRPWLNALVQALAGQPPREDHNLLETLAQRRSALRQRLDEVLQPHQASRPIHFGVAMQRLARQLADEAIVVTGTGNHREWARWCIPVRHPLSQVPAGMWGTMGSELPGAIAAKLAHPNRLVVAVTGDGSLLMGGSDVVTAVETGANILVVVMNDARYGMIEEEQRKKFGRTIGTALQPVDFAAWAKSCGAAGYRVERPEDLDAVFEQAIARTRQAPVLVDVVAGAEYPCLSALEQVRAQPAGAASLGRRITQWAGELIGQR